MSKRNRPPRDYVAELREQVQAMADTMETVRGWVKEQEARAWAARRELLGVERPQLRVIVGAGHGTPERASLRVVERAS